jgi:hypothetical protein
MIIMIMMVIDTNTMAKVEEIVEEIEMVSECFSEALN